MIARHSFPIGIICFSFVLVGCSEKIDLPIHLGMPRDSAYLLFAKQRADTTFSGNYYLRGVAMLGTDGTLLLRFDSVDRLNFYCFRTTIDQADRLIKSAKQILGEPDDNESMGNPVSYRVLMWDTGSVVYSFDQERRTCSFCSQPANLGSPLPQPTLPAAPRKKSLQTLWIGMPRTSVYKWLGKSTPDSTGAENYEMFFHSTFLGVSGSSGVRFDSSGRLIDFYFVAPADDWPVLVKNALSAFGKPMRHGPLPQSHESYDNYYWGFETQSYNLFQNAHGSQLDGNLYNPPRAIPGSNFSTPH